MTEYDKLEVDLHDSSISELMIQFYEFIKKDSEFFNKDEIKNSINGII